MVDITKRIALEIGVIGVVNIQFAIKDETLYVIEVNPRAFKHFLVSKYKGFPTPRLQRTCLGNKLTDELTARPSGKGLYH